MRVCVVFGNTVFQYGHANEASLNLKFACAVIKAASNNVVNKGCSLLLLGNLYHCIKLCV